MEAVAPEIALSHTRMSNCHVAALDEPIGVGVAMFRLYHVITVLTRFGGVPWVCGGRRGCEELEELALEADLVDPGLCLQVSAAGRVGPEDFTYEAFGGEGVA